MALKKHVYQCLGCLGRTTFQFAEDYLPFFYWHFTCWVCRRYHRHDLVSAARPLTDRGKTFR